ncbi:MAG: hypothetical protein QNJ14_09410 [Woeseiaceae bacterium]|nr:hypothetical protein [Woeseiaceae bacterium]
MTCELVGPLEAAEINAQVDRLLRDLGDPEPPLSLELVRELLRLDLKYYSAKNTSHLQDLTHKIRLGAKQIAARPGLIFDAIKKAKLAALYVPDTKRILIDEDIPKPKHRWIEAHEISHGLIEWHSDFLFGDNRVTLNPLCDATIEAEANYGGGRLLFLGDKFGEEARSEELSFKNIRQQAGRYGNSIQSTLWRVVEEREPDSAVFGMVSDHPNHPEIGQIEYGGKPRLIRSNGFRKQFGNVAPDDVYTILAKHANWNKGGPIVDAEDSLVDINGDSHEIRIESFSNTHSLLTYGVCTGPTSVIVSA